METAPQSGYDLRESASGLTPALRSLFTSVLDAEESFLPLGGLVLRWGDPDNVLPGCFPALSPGPVAEYRSVRVTADGMSRKVFGNFLDDFGGATVAGPWAEVGLDTRGDWDGRDRGSWRACGPSPRSVRQQLASGAAGAQAAAFAARLGTGGRVVSAASGLFRSPGRVASCLLLHEVGHHRLCQAAGIPGGPGGQDFRDLQGYRHPLTAPLLADGGAVPPTLYAASSAHEWFAECYALWRMGRTDLLSATDLAFLSRVLGPCGPRAPGATPAPAPPASRRSPGPAPRG